MEHEFDLAEASLPYQVRHNIWNPDEVEEQLEEQGLYEPDAVYLMPVPESEQEAHVEQVEELVDDIESPDTVYFNRDSREAFAEVLDEFDDAEEVPIRYPESASRKADFEHLNNYFDGDQTFLGIGQDYSVPRNHRLASENIDEWNGPENGFPFEVEGQNQRGSSLMNYVVDRMNTWDGTRAENFSGDLNLKDGQHFIVGTTYSDDFSDYSEKFGLGKQSEIVRSTVPQKFQGRF